MKRRYRRTVKIALVLVYLVICAGAVVRMTGSGMGCPDWPKCFGYYIPPTDISDLQFKSNFEYKKGIVIIVDEAQNATIHELKTIITRVGKNSKIVLLGDTDQIDLKRKHDTGLDFLSSINTIERLKKITLLENHRHPILDDIMDVYKRQETAKSVKRLGK